MNFEKLYINGEWVDSASGNWIEVENPATRKRFARVPAGNPEDVNRAANVADTAFLAWSQTPLAERIALMEKFLAIFESQKDILIDITIQELGSPRTFTTNSQVEYQYTRIKSYIETARHMALTEDFPLSTVYREPIGVIGCITPWNYPLGQVVQKVIPALLMGNTIILKPSQHTPLSAYYLTEAMEQAGFPKGVFNLITGRGGEVGNALATHPKVNMISFTGSTQGGSTVGKQAIERIKHVSLELGGKSPYIILPDLKNLDEAIHLCFNSIFHNSGQTCTAFSRLLIPKEHKERIETRLVEIAKEYTTGDPQKESTRIGPVASQSQFDKIKMYIEKGCAEGARMIVGSIPTQPTTGYYIDPVIFTDVTNDMTIAQNEIFGPVLCVLTYTDIEEAIRIANDTRYGLNAGIYGEKEKALSVARQIQSGNVYINAAPRDTNAPFGGYKESGIGKEGGLYGLLEFTQQKSIFDRGE